MYMFSHHVSMLLDAALDDSDALDNNDDDLNDDADNDSVSLTTRLRTIPIIMG